MQWISHISVVCYCIYSKYACNVPLIDKEDETIVKSFWSLIKSITKPDKVWVDKGEL